MNEMIDAEWRRSTAPTPLDILNQVYNGDKARLMEGLGPEGRKLMDSEWERAAEPHPRDLMKEEHNRSLTRPRNEALEKWGPLIEEWIESDLRSGRNSGAFRVREALNEQREVRREGPDLDLEKD